MRRARRKRNGLVIVGVAAIALLLAIPAFGQLTGFELDGNTKNPDGQDIDWEDVFDAAGVRKASLPSTYVTGFHDDYALPDETTFATGSKDTLDITPGWQCAKSNNVGDKVDIVNAYATAYRATPTSDLLLYFAVEISSPNGDSNIGMWFLKNGDVDCQAKGKGAKAFTGSHDNGDVFVVSAFTNGGRTANVDVYEWMNGSLIRRATGGLCTDLAAQDVCAITNVDNVVNPDWPNPTKSGEGLPPQTFFEGGVNLTDIGIADGCFARYLANTRSSQSLTATIFDFTTDAFPICNPSTTLSATATAEVTYTFKETNDGDVVLTKPSGGWVTSSDCTVAEELTTGGKNVGDADGDGKLDPWETFEFTCTKTVSFTGTSISAKVTVIGHGIDPAGRDVTFDCGGNALCVPDTDEKDSVTVSIS